MDQLIITNEILPEKVYLKLAEVFSKKFEEKYINDKIYHSYSKI